MSEFSEHVKLLRKQQKLVQSTVAEALSISLRQYQRYEKGEQEPTIQGLILLADFFGVSIDYLVGRTNNPEVNSLKE